MLDHLELLIYLKITGPLKTNEWFSINGSSPILYNVTTDLRYGTTPYGTFTPSLPVYNALNGSFNSLIIGIINITFYNNY